LAPDEVPVVAREVAKTVDVAEAGRVLADTVASNAHFHISEAILSQIIDRAVGVARMGVGNS